MKILITGVAGFIGFHTALNYLKKKYTIVELIQLITTMT